MEQTVTTVAGTQRIGRGIIANFSSASQRWVERHFIRLSATSPNSKHHRNDFFIISISENVIHYWVA